MQSFKDRLKQEGNPYLRADGIDVLQVNLGYRCNMSCKHCHVNAGPSRPEVMSKEDIGLIIGLLKLYPIKALDLTGGAPELNPYFRHIVEEAREAKIHVIVRSNLTIFFEEGMEGLPQFYRDQGVEIIASLPYYMEDGVDRVRGRGAFEKSIEAIRMLNGLSYGREGSGMVLNLVYNPQGAFLPPDQKTLEADYRRELEARFGIVFSSLFTFTNMPLGRFRQFLDRTNNFDRYMEKLACGFNPENLKGIMCRKLISIKWDGRIFDCDFNQMVDLGVLDSYPRTIRDFDFDALSTRTIALGDHCYGCTAGQGST